MQKLVECFVCLSSYDSLTKAPKNLVCGHSVCLQCATSLLQGATIRCPKCRSDTFVPRCEVASLATNYTVIDALESICVECQNALYTRPCAHCSRNICESCKAGHASQIRNDVSELIQDLDGEIARMIEECDECGDSRGEEDDLTRRGDAIHNVKEYWRFIRELVEQRESEAVSKTEKLFDDDRGERDTNRQNLKSTLKEYHSFVRKYADELDPTSGGNDVTYQRLENIKEHVVMIKSDLSDCAQQQHSVLCVELAVSRDQAENFLLDFDVIPVKRRQPIREERVSDEIPSPSTSQSQSEPSRSTSSVTESGCEQPTDSLVTFLGTVLAIPWAIILCSMAIQHWMGDISWSPASPLPKYCDFGIVQTFRYERFLPIDVTRLNHSHFVVVGFDRIDVLDGQLTTTETISLHNADAYPTYSGVTSDTLTGRIYVSDRDNDVINVVNSDGELLDRIEAGGTGATQLDQPNGLTLDARGYLYVCDGGNGRVLVFDRDLQLVRSIGDLGPTSARFKAEPTFVAVTSRGEVVVTDDVGHLYVFDERGEHLRTLTAGRPGSFAGARGAIIDDDGTIIVTDRQGQLVVMRADGAVYCTLKGTTTDSNLLSSPRGVTLTDKGTILVCDGGNRRLVIFS